MAFVTSFRSVAHSWMCDHLGHLNTRNYVGFFDDSMQPFFHIIGYRRDPNFGWADVRHVIEYKGEVKPGSIVHVDCAIIKIGNKSITYRQRLITSDDGIVCATNDATSVLFDLSKREAVILPDVIRDNIVDFMVPEDEN